MAEEKPRGSDRGDRRSKRMLGPSQKYEIWLQLVRGEVTMAEAAVQWQIDRSTIMRIRTVAKDGALAALAASRPGARSRERDYELEAVKADNARLTGASRRDPSRHRTSARLRVAHPQRVETPQPPPSPPHHHPPPVQPRHQHRPPPTHRPPPSHASRNAASPADGAAPVYRGDPGYGSHLDRDNDGGRRE